jgi:cellulose biosynthesis protein BcsQ
MSSPDMRALGHIWTFYSYKGGVGRSMALANIAVLLAQWGHKVLVVDWDLEAPGLEKYFDDAAEGWSARVNGKPGVVDIAYAAAQDIECDWQDGLIRLPLSRTTGILDLLSAGRRDDEYVARLQHLDWDVLFREHNFGQLLEDIRDQWRKSYDYVLLDSRTGFSDIGGICTIYLPDVLVAMFTANQQSVEGLAEVVSRARTARSGLPVDRTALVCVPVPSRDESRIEYQLSSNWRSSIYLERFADYYSDFLPRNVTANDALGLLRIPSVPFWSFGERLPVLTESITDPSLISYYYAILARLIKTDLSWEDSATGQATEGGRESQAGTDAYVAARDIYIPQNIAADPPRRIWERVPARNRSFIGREEQLQAIRSALLSSNAIALEGMDGVGKTQLAIEYAHRFADDYVLVWWIAADNPELIAEQFASLAVELGVAEAGAPLDIIRRAALTELRQRSSWLLVFDGAENPEDITSRAQGWAEIALSVQVDVLGPDESAEMLRRRVRGLTAEDAAAVAEALGNLPLALAQAAGYMSETGTPAGEYLALLKDRATEILNLGKPASYPESLTAVTELAYDRLRGQDPAAGDLAAICAFLGTESVPPDWFSRAADRLPAPLREQAVEPLAWRQLLATLGRSALVRVDPAGIVMHRLTQAIIRGDLPAESAAIAGNLAVAVVAANHPGDPHLPETWPIWALALPHLLAIDPGGTSDQNVLDMAIDAVAYLLQRGDFGAGHALATYLFGRWRDRLGADHQDTLRMQNALSAALLALGRAADARALDEDALGRMRRVLGDDHLDTLDAAGNLAADLARLGEYAAARELDEDTLARRYRLQDEDHPDTLATADRLAYDLYLLREYPAAREMAEDVLARQRRVLGADHPGTLVSATNLSAILLALDEVDAARALIADTLARRRRVLGYDHPDTLLSASVLAATLKALGDYEAARALEEETLARRRQVLGDDHPHTRQSALDLADLRALG